MKILHILSSDDKYGSAQCIMELIKKEKDANEIEPYVLTPKYNDINRFCELNNIKNYVIKYKQFQIPKHNNFVIFFLKFIIHTINYYLYRNQAVKSIENIVLKEKISIIHTNSSVIDIGGIIAKKLNLPHIWHLREFGKEDFNFYSCRKKFIKFMNNSNSVFIAISEAVAKVWINKGLDRTKIKILYDGVDTSKFSKIKRDYFENKIKIAMIGSFCEAKGQKYLVEAVNELSQMYKDKVSVTFFGIKEGSYYNNLCERVDNCKLNNIIEFKGFSNDIPRELLNYDIGVLCSKSEAFGRVTVEYMMAGLCPVVTSGGANDEIVSANKCGIIYEYGEEKELCENIRLLMDNKELVLKYGKKARKIAFEKYDSNKNLLDIINFIKKIEEDNARDRIG